MNIYIITLCAVISLIDIRKQIIPDLLTIALALSVFYYGYHAAWIIPLLVYFVTLLIVSAFNLQIPYGMGDAKYFSAIALSFGFEGLCFSYAIASMAAAAMSIILLLCKKINKKSRIAFGPFISAALILYVTFFKA